MRSLTWVLESSYKVLPGLVTSGGSKGEAVSLPFPASGHIPWIPSPMVLSSTFKATNLVSSNISLFSLSYHLLLFCNQISLCPLLIRTPVVAFRAPWIINDNLPISKSLNLWKSLLSYKITFRGSRFSEHCYIWQPLICLTQWHKILSTLSALPCSFTCLYTRALHSKLMSRQPGHWPLLRNLHAFSSQVTFPPPPKQQESALLCVSNMEKVFLLHCILTSYLNVAVILTVFGL